MRCHGKLRLMNLAGPPPHTCDGPFSARSHSCSRCGTYVYLSRCSCGIRFLRSSRVQCGFCKGCAVWVGLFIGTAAMVCRGELAVLLIGLLRI